jgi:predicted AlkP superfamily phosphohydrolase/phosphomutase
MTHQSKRRALLIGLDGATWRLLDPMMEEGVLPNLARLTAGGAWGELESTIPPVTAPAWTTFQTGVLPGKHGVYDFNQYSRQSYRTTFASSRDIRSPGIWELASDSDKRVAVVNVPLTYPPRPMNGFLIAGMQTPNLKSDFTHPSGLREEFLRTVPDYRIIVPQTEFNLHGLDRFVDMSIKAEQARFDAFRYVLKEKCPDWDLAMVHVQSTDTVQHAIYCWLDATDTRFSRDRYTRALSLYKAIDEQIGSLLSDFTDDETLVIVLSDHGHGSIYKTINVNAHLYHMGFLSLTGAQTSFSFTGWLRKALRVLLRMDRWNLNKALLPKRFRRPFMERLSQNMMIDWEHTQAYMINGWVYAYIYLNVKGRELAGVVEPALYEKVRAKVAKAMKELCDPETGQPVVGHVHPREEVFEGEFAQAAPDLIVVPAPGYEFTASVFQDTEAVIRHNRVGRDHVGSHTMDGILVASGAMVRPGPIVGARLVDLFPTILAWLGVPIPSITDGRVLKEAFIDDPFGDLQVDQEKNGVIDTVDDSLDEVYSAQDQALIEERLRALGYM